MIATKIFAAIAIFLGFGIKFAFYDPDIRQNIPCTTSLCGSELEIGQPPSSTSHGRWREPLKSEIILGTSHPFFKYKRWNYMSANFQQDLFVALAIVHFNYIGDVFLYVVDKSGGNDDHIEFHTQRPLGFGVKFSPSSLQGCSSLDDSISICFDEDAMGWKIKANVDAKTVKTHETKNIQFDLVFHRHPDKNDALVLVYPLGNNPNRTAYVHKGAGMSVEGQVIVDGKKHDKLIGSGAIDWTCALALHDTQWRWVSFSEMNAIIEISGNNQTKMIGVNFSNKVYDAINHESNTTISTENAIWIDGHPFPITETVQILPGEKYWKILSKNIKLNFQPQGTRQDYLDLSFLGILSHFQQPYGIFTGYIDIPVLQARIYINTFGVVENHLALW